MDSSPGFNATYTLPAPPLGTEANAGNQQRGGAGGIVSATTTATDIVNPVSGGTAPSPTQDGLVTNVRLTIDNDRSERTRLTLGIFSVITTPVLLLETAVRRLPRATRLHQHSSMHGTLSSALLVLSAQPPYGLVSTTASARGSQLRLPP